LGKINPGCKPLVRLPRERDGLDRLGELQQQHARVAAGGEFPRDKVRAFLSMPFHLETAGMLELRVATAAPEPDDVAGSALRPTGGDVRGWTHAESTNVRSAAIRITLLPFVRVRRGCRRVSRIPCGQPGFSGWLASTPQRWRV